MLNNCLRDYSRRVNAAICATKTNAHVTVRRKQFVNTESFVSIAPLA